MAIQIFTLKKVQRDLMLNTNHLWTLNTICNILASKSSPLYLRKIVFAESLVSVVSEINFCWMGTIQGLGYHCLPLHYLWMGPPLPPPLDSRLGGLLCMKPMKSLPSLSYSKYFFPKNVINLFVVEFGSTNKCRE